MCFPNQGGEAFRVKLLTKDWKPGTHNNLEKEKYLQTTFVQITLSGSESLQLEKQQYHVQCAAEKKGSQQSS